MKILILTCSTGEGHNSAAKAVAEVLNSRGIECEITDPLSLSGKKTGNVVATIYNKMISKIPILFGLIYKIGQLYDASHLPSPVYLANSRHADKLYGYIKEHGFDAVVCPHLFPMQSMTAVKRKCEHIPSFGILTDHVAIPFYRETDLDGYFAPDEPTKGQLIKKGIPEERILCTGIPVSPKFSSEISNTEAKAVLGIPKDKRMVAVMSGGAGCGKIVRLTRRLDKTLDGSRVIYVFPGKNKKLKQRLEKRFSENDRVRIVGFTDKISMYIKAADVVLSKPGGLSTTEIAASGTPLVLMRAVSGCETANVKYFTANGLAIHSGSIRRAVEATCRLLGDGELSEGMVQNQKSVINRAAAEQIVNKVIEELS